MTDSALNWWPLRATLAARGTFSEIWPLRASRGGNNMQHTSSAYGTPMSIAFAEVATHNHFVLDRGGKVFKQTAPVIKLSEGATEDEHLALLGVLNSSTACFWLKQVCHDKGLRGEGGGFTPSDWERFYQYNGSNVQGLSTAECSAASARADARFAIAGIGRAHTVCGLCSPNAD